MIVTQIPKPLGSKGYIIFGGPLSPHIATSIETKTHITKAESINAEVIAGTNNLRLARGLSFEIPTGTSKRSACPTIITATKQEKVFQTPVSKDISHSPAKKQRTGIRTT